MTTIKDVAARAGVSISTVHYALNGKRPISEAVRQRVLAAAEELKYRASTLGPRMREGRSYSIGLVAPTLPTADASVLGMLVTTAATASAAHHSLGLCLDQGVDQVLALLRQQVVDGLILVETTHLDPRIEALRPTPCPFVLIGRTADLAGLTSVDFDFESAVFTAFEHLVALGHRTICFIAPHPTPDSNMENWYGLERAQAAYVFPSCGRPRHSPWRTAGAPRITAIMATGRAPGRAARPVHPEAAGAGRLLGDRHHDGAGADSTTPALTSVDISLTDMSVTATRLLLRQLAGEAVTEQRLMPARLVVRGSTAPPR